MKIKEEIIKKAEQMAKELEEGKDVVIKKSKYGVQVQALSIKKIN